MLKTETKIAPAAAPAAIGRCRVAVIWIDWYAYHLARFAGLVDNSALAGTVTGIELVGGVGVHAGLRFREELPAGLPVETLFPQENWREAGQLRVAMKLWQALDRLQPETVLVPGYYTLPALAAALWARAHGRKSVLMTESTRSDHRRSWWKEATKGALIRALFNWAVAGGAPHARYLRDLHFPAERIARFYDVVDNEGLYLRCHALQREPRHSYGLPGRYFLYVGRLAAEKNLGGLLDAYLWYRAAGGAWSLVLVGDGPERSELESRAASSAFSPDIHFAGHKGSAELPLYYAFAGCFVLPSTREPWGLVVNEAMACGLPVIVSDRCGCAEDLVADGENGFVFDPDADGRLASLLATVEQFTQEQWVRMGCRSLERIAEFSPQKFAEQIAWIASA